MTNKIIKFRVWDGVDFMSSPFDLHDLMFKRIEFTRDVHVMQFTGLLDKNGKEIYEGDYIQDYGGNIAEVIWGDYGWLVDYKVETMEPEGIDKWGTVISNIYEPNPTLPTNS